MSTTNTHATALLLPVIPLGINLHYETENRTVWNQEKYTSEEHEFVYEISWIPDLGVWRRFLRKT
jgi:hypothetical protein